MADAGGKPLTGPGAAGESPYDDTITADPDTWIGAGNTALWSNPANWLNGDYPSWSQPAEVVFGQIPAGQTNKQYDPDFTGAPPCCRSEFSRQQLHPEGRPDYACQQLQRWRERIAADNGVTNCVISANLVVGLAGGGTLNVGGGTLNASGGTGDPVRRKHLHRRRGDQRRDAGRGRQRALGAGGNGIEIDSGGKLDLAGYNLTAGTVTLTNGSIVNSGAGELAASALDVIQGTITPTWPPQRSTNSEAPRRSSAATIRAPASPRSTPGPSSSRRPRPRRRCSAAPAPTSRAGKSSSTTPVPPPTRRRKSIRRMLAGTIDSSTLGSGDALGWIDSGLVWAGADNVVVAYTLLGDANCDGTVNGTDLDLLADNWGTNATTWAQGDFYNCYGLQNEDPGTIGPGDLDYLKPNFGESVALPPQVVSISRLGTHRRPDHRQHGSIRGSLQRKRRLRDCRRLRAGHDGEPLDRGENFDAGRPRVLRLPRHGEQRLRQRDAGAEPGRYGHHQGLRLDPGRQHAGRPNLSGRVAVRMDRRGNQ